MFVVVFGVFFLSGGGGALLAFPDFKQSSEGEVVVSSPTLFEQLSWNVVNSGDFLLFKLRTALLTSDLRTGRSAGSLVLAQWLSRMLASSYGTYAGLYNIQSVREGDTVVFDELRSYDDPSF